jgi:hypothetical protein
MKRSRSSSARTGSSPIGRLAARLPGNRRLFIAVTRVGIIATAGLGVLCLRFHYIEEGRALGRQTAYVQGLARGKQLAICPKTDPAKGGAIGRAQHQR